MNEWIQLEGGTLDVAIWRPFMPKCSRVRRRLTLVALRPLWFFAGHWQMWWPLVHRVERVVGAGQGSSDLRIFREVVGECIVREFVGE